MDHTTNFVTLLARMAGGAGSRHRALRSSAVLSALVLFVLAFAVGVLAVDLLAQESEAVLAAPFRWVI